MLKVALQLREHDLPEEVLDFQACWDGLANELVVRFDFLLGVSINISPCLFRKHMRD